VQHVTIGIIPSFGYRPTSKTLNRLKFLYTLKEIRIPNSSCIFKIGADECHIIVRISIKFAREHANLLSGFGTECLKELQEVQLGNLAEMGQHLFFMGGESFHTSLQ